MKWWKVTAVIFGALVITALGIDAADTLQGSQGTLLSQVISRGGGGVCPDGMQHVENVSSLTCVDTYEVSPNPQCPNGDPAQMLGTLQNIESSGCMADSKVDALPWRYVTRDQAMQMCARSGKRLPTSDEWYALSLGMAQIEQSCNISSKNVAKVGTFAACTSPHGVQDLVGNVWEWVSDDVTNGMYKTAVVPDSGYVAQVDSSGMATLVDGAPQELFGNDYFWSRKEGSFGIIRGGYYDSGSDAGIYTVHADTLPTSASAGIGFRCVK